MRFTVGFVCALLAATTLGSASVAQAQNARSFVSGKGLDTNPCSLAAPCRSFAQAVTVTNAGGEVAVLDTAGYGPVTITKSVSIINQDGVEAGIAVTSAGNAISIQAGANDVVNLRGLTITGNDVGSSGINFQSGGALTVRNTTIRNFVQNGLQVTSGKTGIVVSDVILSDIASNGIHFAPTSSATLVVQSSQISRCGNIGILLQGAFAPAGAAIVGTVSDSLLTGNLRGIFLNGSSVGGQPVTYIVGSKIVSNSDIGLVVSRSKAYLSQSVIAGHNLFGFTLQFDGTLSSFGNNSIVDTINQGNLTPIAQR